MYDRDPSMTMYANNSFLKAMSNKLIEIAEQTMDAETKEELNQLVEVMASQMEMQANSIERAFQHVLDKRK